MIADDSSMFKEKLVMSVLGVDQISSIARATNCDDAIDLFEKVRPEIVVLDISNSLEDALKILEHVKGVNPNTIVFMLVKSSQEEFRKKCVDLHADYFFDKFSEYDNLLNTLMSIMYSKDLYN
jgi:chemotaxis response regulator CheB